MVAASILLGSGCNESERTIELQQNKEQNIIKVQRQKEEDVLKYQQTIRAQEESDKQAQIDDCLTKAINKRRKNRDIAYGFIGLNYGLIGPPTDPAQHMHDVSVACQKKFSHEASFCMDILADSLAKDRVAYEKDEANCYVRFR